MNIPSILELLNLQYGLIFGIYSLGSIFSSLFFARYGKHIGQDILYKVGQSVLCICEIAFGFVAYAENTHVFLGVSYLIRFLQGIADGASWGALLSVLLTLFPTSASKISAGTELFVGLGMALGPSLATWLYNIGGFILPFTIVGSIGMSFPQLIFHHNLNCLFFNKKVLQL